MSFDECVDLAPYVSCYLTAYNGEGANYQLPGMRLGDHETTAFTITPLVTNFVVHEAIRPAQFMRLK